MTSLREDPGLQPERTSLSWQRTQASLLVVSALFLRWYPQWGALTFVPIAFACVTVLGISATQRRRYHRSVSSIETSPSGAHIGSAFLVAGSCAAIGAAGLLVILFAR